MGDERGSAGYRRPPLLGMGERVLMLMALAMIIVLVTLLRVPAVWETMEPSVYRITFIDDGSSEAASESFRKGAMRAALDMNADLRYISMAQEGDAVRQTDYIYRELENGADCVILTPMDAEYTDGMLDGRPIHGKLVTVGQALEAAEVCVASDSISASNMLGDAVAESWRSCALFISDYAPSLCRRQLDLAAEALGRRGIRVKIIRGEESFEAGVSANWSSALVAFEEDVLLTLCGLAEGSPTPRVYGTAVTTELLMNVDRGRIGALICESRYDAGYMSVKSAVDAVEGRQTEDVSLRLYTVTAENMYEAPVVKAMFPIS